MIDLQSQIDKNALYAFTCYVRDWKKQDPDTITVEKSVYTFSTRRGIKHSFRVVKHVTPLKVQGFYFEEL